MTATHRNGRSHTVVILGHPNPSSFNAALAESYAEGARANSEVTLLKLHQLRFDPVLRPRGAHCGTGATGERQPFEPDLRIAQEAIEQADHVVFLFPIWWGGLPSLLKGFIDRVFHPGWAYRQRPGALPEKLLTGRTARVIMTMDAPGWYAALVYRNSARRAMVNATLKYCGFGPVWTSTFTRISARTDSERATMVSNVRRAGERDAARIKPRRMPEPAAAV